jgi:hypothetical protein
MPESSFDGQPDMYGVGVNQIIGSSAKALDTTLFTFDEDHG